MMSETTTEFHSFPEDLFRNILLRLPAKSIVRFKCVSKLWFSISVDPSFLLEHARSTPDCILIQTHRSEVGDSNVYLQLLPPDTAALFPDRRRNATNRVVASCDGLLCLLDNQLKLGIRYYYVLNPLTGARIDVPNTTWTTYSQVMGLYFNSSTHEYCLIKITASVSALDEVQVTSLNGGTWRTLDSLPVRALASFRSPINVNGILYWFAHIDMKFRILGFDIMKEEFKLIALPLEDQSVFIRCDLINMRHRLGFVIVNQELSSVSEIEIDIWIMEDYEHVHWQKIYSVRCCAFDDSDFQFEYWAIKSAFYIKEEEIVISFSGSRSYLLQFDLKVKKYWLLQTLPFGELIERSCFLYKKSLVSPNFFLRDE